MKLDQYALTGVLLDTALKAIDDGYVILYTSWR